MKKLLALLVLFVLSVPAFAQDDSKKQPTKEDIILKKLDDLQKSLDSIKDLRKDVEKNAKDIKELNKTLSDLRADIDALKKANAAKSEEPTKLKPPPHVEVTRTPYKRDRRDYDDDDDVVIMKRTSDKKSYNNPAEVQYGKVRIVNTYPTTSYSVTVNGERYTVRGGETKIVDYVMPGEFSYQIHGVTEVRKRTLSPNETFTVTIFPQQDKRSYTPSRSYYYDCPPPVMRYCED